MSAKARSFSLPRGRTLRPSMVKLAGCTPTCVDASVAARPDSVRLMAR